MNLNEVRSVISSANRGTIIFDYFFCMDYTTYIKIIAIISRLFRFFFKNYHDYTRLLHYLQKDDYSGYCNTIISLIVFGIYYGDYLYYIKIIRIIGIIAIIFLYPRSYCSWTSGILYTWTGSGKIVCTGMYRYVPVRTGICKYRNSCPVRTGMYRYVPKT